MLADGLVFSCGEEVDALYGIISCDANQASEMMHSWFKVVEKLQLDIILGFNWFQSINHRLTRSIIVFLVKWFCCYWCAHLSQY